MHEMQHVLDYQKSTDDTATSFVVAAAKRLNNHLGKSFES